MRRLPPLNALRSFEAAARLGSFNRAAEELFVTPSAVSHQIKSLEAFLGVPLFRRENRRTVLTATGEKYFDAAGHALDEIGIATRRLIASPNTSAVNISVVPAFLTRWLVPRIRDFQELHPDVELRLSASTGLIDFAHSDTDMAIYFGHGEWENVDAHFLKSVTLIPVCSPKLLEETVPLDTPGDLQRHTLLQVADREDEWSRILKKASIVHIADIKSITLSSTSLSISAAMEGAGVALADLSLVERELEYGQLIIPLDIKLETRRAFYLVYQQNRQLTYAMQVFYDWVMEEIQQG
ncbi:transcriptional regulator [Solemya velesiana gill symbiont]|uniref:Transcriptional regulator n=1 Tax=Solemya velesiana gill symbiont TaxID=1918948 RepID=A0A1T2KSL8_9GAMM|nr:transcriptional regulator GcvA [Solemya velesiana gill symbiont]OOZ35700.1 transcriptional regulator [Solemya velesiana gill symbiont]